MNNAQDLIQLNNEKRKQLTQENLRYYEGILVYIRLSFFKSEQDIEDVLSELLDHLLEAQAEGKTAEEVFGVEAKQYADDIIGELPDMATKKRELFLTIGMGVLYFIAAGTFITGVITLGLYYVFDIGEFTRNIFVGSLIIRTLISAMLAFLLVIVIFRYIRWSCFKQINKKVEFLLMWIFGMISICIFAAVIYFVPKFSPIVEIPIYVTLPLGICLYVAAHMTRKAI